MSFGNAYLYIKESRGVKVRMKKEKSFLKMMREDVTGIYLVFMLCVYPLFTVNGYVDLLYRKWDLFLYGSTIYILLMIVVGAPVIIGECKKKKRPRLSPVDMFVSAYLICVIISYVGAVDKTTALWGIDTWYMGFVTQLLLVGIYFCISAGCVKLGPLKYLCGAVYLIVSGIVVLQRFRVDVFGFHEGMLEEVKLNFVTTLGQVTWSSSYISIMLTAAIGIFFGLEKAADIKDKLFKQKVFWAICIFTGFASLSVLNCDSAVIAVGAAGLILIWMAIGNREKILRLMEILLLALLAAAVIGIFERIYADRLIPIDSIYIIAATSPLLYILLIITAALYILISKNIIRITGGKKRIKIVRSIYTAILLIITAGVILLFILHGKGLFAGSPTENYFRFTVWWGNSRGFIWRTGAAVFADFSLWRKLFGCGPECFTPYSYQLMGDAINEFWHYQIVPNVHNEWFNAIINYGIIGGAAYLGIFLTSAKTFLSDGAKKAAVTPEIFGIGLAAAAYIAHNILCYQQIIGTPLIFILLAIANAKNKE